MPRKRVTAEDVRAAVGAAERPEIRQAGVDPEFALSHCVQEPSTYWEGVCGSDPGMAGLVPAEYFRGILLDTVEIALERWAAPWIPDDVRALAHAEMKAVAENNAHTQRILDPGHGRTLRSLARIWTLDRVPCGQLDWEMDGFPRSWMFKSGVVAVPGLASFVVLRLKGFKPLAHAHLNGRRKNAHLLTEKGFSQSYQRIAQCLEGRPEIKGYITASWLFARETEEITPHLAWLRRVPLEHGAREVVMEPADASDGFLTASEARREAYEAGTYRPRVTAIVWPRTEMLAWARRRR